MKPRSKYFPDGAAFPLIVLRAIAVGIVWGLVSIDRIHIAVLVAIALVIGHIHALLVDAYRSAAGWDR